ncbi:unnamed protein product, partial [Polarella glacialis]
LHVPVVFRALKDRWFVALKPAGFASPASPPFPSVEATLRPFVGGRALSFPVRPDREGQGLVVVTTDDAMHKSFDELVRRRLVQTSFRVLADVSGLSPSEVGDLRSHICTPSGQAEGLSKVRRCELQSGPIACPQFGSLQTAIFLVQASTSAASQVRTRFAEAGCPLLFDQRHHPRYIKQVQSGIPGSFHGVSDFWGGGTEEDEKMPLVGALGMQLCLLEMPDPFRYSQRLRISAPLPKEWDAIHPALEADPGYGEDCEDLLG